MIETEGFKLPALMFSWCKLHDNWFLQRLTTGWCKSKTDSTATTANMICSMRRLYAEENIFGYLFLTHKRGMCILYIVSQKPKSHDLSCLCSAQSEEDNSFFLPMGIFLGKRHKEHHWTMSLAPMSGVIRYQCTWKRMPFEDKKTKAKMKIVCTWLIVSGERWSGELCLSESKYGITLLFINLLDLVLHWTLLCHLHELTWW